MLEKVRKALKRDNGGAQSRTVKQSPQAQESPAAIPEVHESMRGAKGRVLRYLVKNQNAYISYEDIARGSGTAKSKIGKHIKELVSEGLVVHSKPRPRHGTSYQIIGGGPNSSKVSENASFIGGSQQDDIDFVKITNSLVFEFIRATRSTDVLLYLTWVERQGGRDA